MHLTPVWNAALSLRDKTITYAHASVAGRVRRFPVHLGLRVENPLRELLEAETRALQGDEHRYLDKGF